MPCSDSTLAINKNIFTGSSSRRSHIQRSGAWNVAPIFGLTTMKKKRERERGESQQMLLLLLNINSIWHSCHPSIFIPSFDINDRWLDCGFVVYDGSNSGEVFVFKCFVSVQVRRKCHTGGQMLNVCAAAKYFSWAAVLCDCRCRKATFSPVETTTREGQKPSLDT